MPTNDDASASGSARERQMHLPIGPRFDLDDALVVSRSNENGVALLQRPDVWMNGVAGLVGPRGSGKTFIARTLHPDTLLISTQILLEGAFTLDQIDEADAFLFDDADRAFAETRDDALESALFHLVNRVAAVGARFIFLARDCVANWAFRTPDLRTRFAAAPCMRLQLPDEALFEQALNGHLKRRGVRPPASIVTHLVKRAPRDLHLVRGLSDALARRMANGGPQLRAEEADGLLDALLREAVADAPPMASADVSSSA